MPEGAVMVLSRVLSRMLVLFRVVCRVLCKDAVQGMLCCFFKHVLAFGLREARVAVWQSNADFIKYFLFDEEETKVTFPTGATPEAGQVLGGP